MAYLMVSGYKKESMEEVMQHTDDTCRSGRMAVKDALDIIGGKWKLLIITILMSGKKRFGELCREAEVSPKVLTKDLRELEINGLLTRTVCATRPLSVEYALTPYSAELVALLGALEKWGQAHRKKVINGF